MRRRLRRRRHNWSPAVCHHFLIGIFLSQFQGIIALLMSKGPWRVYIFQEISKPHLHSQKFHIFFIDDRPDQIWCGLISFFYNATQCAFCFLLFKKKNFDLEIRIICIGIICAKGNKREKQLFPTRRFLTLFYDIVKRRRRSSFQEDCHQKKSWESVVASSSSCHGTVSNRFWSPRSESEAKRNENSAARKCHWFIVSQPRWSKTIKQIRVFFFSLVGVSRGECIKIWGSPLIVLGSDGGLLYPHETEKFISREIPWPAGSSILLRRVCHR